MNATGPRGTLRKRFRASDPAHHRRGAYPVHRLHRRDNRQERSLEAVIINLAFGLILGAIAIAVAIAFGLGGREPAKQILQKLSGKVEKKIDEPPAPKSKSAPPPTS